MLSIRGCLPSRVAGVLLFTNVTFNNGLATIMPRSTHGPAGKQCLIEQYFSVIQRRNSAQSMLIGVQIIVVQSLFLWLGLCRISSHDGVFVRWAQQDSNVCASPRETHEIPDKPRYGAAVSGNGWQSVTLISVHLHNYPGCTTIVGGSYGEAST